MYIMQFHNIMVAILFWGHVMLDDDEARKIYPD